MNQPNPQTLALKPMKIFKMNDCDWWMAPTLEDAKADMENDYQADANEMVKDPRELTEAELDRLQFSDEDGPTTIKHSFREELRQRVALGQGTQMFASTEY